MSISPLSPSNPIRKNSDSGTTPLQPTNLTISDALTAAPSAPNFPIPDPNTPKLPPPKSTHLSLQELLSKIAKARILSDEMDEKIKASYYANATQRSLSRLHQVSEVNSQYAVISQSVVEIEKKTDLFTSHYTKSSGAINQLVTTQNKAIDTLNKGAKEEAKQFESLIQAHNTYVAGIQSIEGTIDLGNGQYAIPDTPEALAELNALTKNYQKAINNFNSYLSKRLTDYTLYNNQTQTYLNGITEIEKNLTAFCAENSLETYFTEQELNSLYPPSATLIDATALVPLSSPQLFSIMPPQVTVLPLPNYILQGSYPVDTLHFITKPADDIKDLVFSSIYSVEIEIPLDTLTKEIDLILLTQNITQIDPPNSKDKTAEIIEEGANNYVKQAKQLAQLFYSRQLEQLIEESLLSFQAKQELVSRLPLFCLEMITQDQKDALKQTIQSLILSPKRFQHSKESILSHYSLSLSGIISHAIEIGLTEQLFQRFFDSDPLFKPLEKERKQQLISTLHLSQLALAKALLHTTPHTSSEMKKMAASTEEQLNVTLSQQKNSLPSPTTVILSHTENHPSLPTYLKKLLSPADTINRSINIEQEQLNHIIFTNQIN